MVPVVKPAVPTAITARWRIRITGVVQGVGFRPFVYRLASTMQLTGWICNDPQGVTLEIQGLSLSDFLDRLLKEAPPLASIQQVSYQTVSVEPGEDRFQILASLDGQGQARIPADQAICNHCLKELFNFRSRFYHYPFISCSNCGPRYTLTQELPYDRCHTSMHDFPRCAACLADYQQPANRRYHTEAIACPACGPQYDLPIADIAKAISQGKIVAVKNLGGYQLICDANQPATVETLRERKRRSAKPFAVMVLNTISAASIVAIDQPAIDLLLSPARPIVLLPKKSASLDRIAPGLAKLGVMLPSTPLHYLLFHYLLENPVNDNWLTRCCPFILVVTSGNLSGEPLIRDGHEAREKLAPLADKLVGHNRRIITHADDSVAALSQYQSYFVRRARGYVPEPIILSQEIPNILGLGGQIKNTLCITRGKEAFVSQHIGDLSNPATIRYYHDTLLHLLKLLNVKPDCVAHDFHPNFYTTQIAHHFGVPHYAIQHHHAHIASVAAEHHWTGPALGLILDGFGLGENQAQWGGELFLYDGPTYRRLASLRPLAQPGGDRAAREPWRMAASVLYALGLRKEILQRFPDIKYNQQLIELLSRPTHCPLTSSCGRLFDAASALLKVCLFNSYEGQAAMQLEALVTKPEVLAGGWIIRDQQLDLFPTLHYLLNCDPVSGANIFHGTLAAALAAWVGAYARTHQIKTILLGGGCFLNQVLLDLLLPQLIAADLQPLLPKLLPPNDGGISLGQAWAVALSN